MANQRIRGIRFISSAGKSYLNILVISISVPNTRCELPLSDKYQIESTSGKYQLNFTSLTGKTTGTISLIDVNTSAVLVKMDIVPGKLRAKPRAVWREGSGDVAIELDTFNPCSPTYIFFRTESKGYVGLSLGTLSYLSGYLGIKAKEISRARFSPLKWQSTPGDGYQIIETREQCWDQKGKRYTKTEPELINSLGVLTGR